MTGVPNNGDAVVTVPSFQDIDQTALRLALVKVSLNIEGLQQKTTLGAIARFAIKHVVKKVLTDIAKRVACDIWHRSSRGVNNDRLPPCPCTIEQMNNDLDRYTKERPFQFFISKYFFKKSQASYCYRQTNVGYVYSRSI